MIKNDGRANLNLPDFGFSTIIQDEESTISGGGPLRSTAPEILEGTVFVSKPADIYSLAMLAFEVWANYISTMHATHRCKVFAGAAPFVDSPPTTVAVQVVSGRRPERPTHSSLTDETWDLIQRCWAPNPSLRPKIREVLRLLRRASMMPPRPVDGSRFLAKDGTTFGNLLRRVSEWPGRVPLSLLGLISRFKGPRSEIPPPALTSYYTKAHFSDSGISVDSWGK